MSPWRAGFGKAVPEPGPHHTAKALEEGRREEPSVYQPQTVRANGHGDRNFSRLHRQETPPDPSLGTTKRLSRWHPGFPHAGWKLPPTPLIYGSLIAFKNKPQACRLLGRAA